MDNLFIEATKKTPEVAFNSSGHLKIKGRSIPEDAAKFFVPLYSWVCSYCLNPNNETIIDIELEYFNSGSSKALLHLFRVLTEIPHTGNQLVLNWHYELGDEDIYERGQYYSSILNFKFNFIEADFQ
jgi:hypothetical protein